MGGFQLLERIETTAGSNWYRARSMPRGRPCLIEVFDPNHVERPDFRRWFRAEAGAAARFRHPEAIRAVAVERAPNRVYLAYDRPTGSRLDGLLARGRARRIPIPVEAALHLAAAVAGVLRTVEQTPIAGGGVMGHGSLTPSDVLVAPDGSVQVGRVGLARCRLELPASASDVAHRAPELLEDRGAFRPASDVYALGLVLFEALVGRAAFERPSVPEAQRAVRAGARSRLVKVRPDVLPNLEALIEWTLAENPSERPQSVGTVLSMIVDALARLPLQRSAGEALAGWVRQVEEGAQWPGGLAVVAPRGSSERPRFEDSTSTFAILPPPPTPSGPEAPHRPTGEPAIPEIPFDHPVEFVPERRARSDRGPATLTDLERLDRAELTEALYDGFVVEASDVVAEKPLDGRYEYARALGSGQVGIGTDLRTGQTVVLEPLPPHLPEDLERRLVELGRVDPHPALLALLETREDASGVPRAVSKYIGGHPLLDVVEAEGPLAIEAAVQLLQSMSSAVGHLHEAGVIHGGLHPEGVLVRRSSDRLEVEVGGLLQCLGDQALVDPAFLPPEQLYGGARRDGRADVWGVGALLFYALSGERPYDAQSRASLADALRTSPVPSLRSVRPSARRFEPVLRAALDPRPDHRPRRVVDLLGLTEGMGARV